MKVGWIGLGRVGQAMALKALEGGHSLTGHARTPAKAAATAAAGGRVTTSLAEAVSGAELVCVNVYSQDQLRDALITGGALAAMTPGAVLAIHSTVGPDLVRELAAMRSDIEVIDAAFSGTDRDAAAGRIALIIGGSAAALEIARPVLSTYADYIALLGPVGSGMLLKLVNNAMFGAQMQIAYEAVKIFEASGLDRKLAIATVARSSGGSFAVGLFGHEMGPDERLHGIRPYMEKDVTIAISALRALGLDPGTIALAAQSFVIEPGS